MRIPGFILSLLVLFHFSSLRAQREIININQNWLFSRDSRMMPDNYGTETNDWEPVNLPHDFQISQQWIAPSPDEKADFENPMANIKSRLSARGFKEMGIGWYKKIITPDIKWEGRRVLLDFEGIMLRGEAFLNGEKIGATDYGYLGFECDITDLLKFDEENIIIVKADTGMPDNSRWYTGGGLFRDVNLVITGKDEYFTRHPLHITTPVADSVVSEISVELEIASFVRRDSIDVRFEVLDPDGRNIYSGRQKLRVNPRQHVKEYRPENLLLKDVKLWDCENPYLYTLAVTLFDEEGNTVDSISERFGIRNIEYSSDSGFRLNGKKVILKGIANHHTLGALGAAAYPKAMEKRIKLLKEFGFNHIRTSHNPYSESFLDLCDENGILVVDELYDKWTQQYTGGLTPWSERWQKDVPEWTRRDRNHPSVIMWSLGNELQLIPDLDFNDWGVTPYRLQKTLLNRYDATRPVTVAMHPRGRNEFTDSLPAPLATVTDIAAYNYRYMYFPVDAENFPEMIFYQSEANASGMGPNFFDMDLNRVTGLAYWGMIDYLGESNGWPAKGWTQGIFDISLQPKPVAYFLKSYFKPEENLVRIAVIEKEDDTVWNDVKVGTARLSYNWNRDPGSVVDLYTFSNCDEVELFLNGKSLGRQRNDTSDSKKRNRILWRKVPYTAGTLEAFAYNNNEKHPAASHKISTFGKVKYLRATPDNPKWKADGKDLQHIVIEAVDAKGERVLSDNSLIRFDISGQAEIIGVINGDMSSDESMTGNTRHLFDGTMTVILRSGNSPGKIKLKAHREGRESTEITMSTVK